MAKLRLLRARSPAKPKVKPGRRKGTARDGSAAGKHNGSAVPGLPPAGRLAGRKSFSRIRRSGVCVWLGGGRGEARVGKEEFKTFRENRAASAERALPGTSAMCATSLQNQTEMRCAVKPATLRDAPLFVRSGKINASKAPNVRAEEKGEGRGRRRRKITPRWSQPVLRSERRPGRPPPPPRSPAGAPASAGSAWEGKTKGRWAALGRRAPGRRSRARGGEGRDGLSPASHPRCFKPAAFHPPQTPFPSGEALSDTPLPPSTRLASYLPLFSQERRPKSGPGKIPGTPGARETPCCEKKANFFLSFYIYRKEIVLLKTLQEQFGNIVNS